VQIATIQNIFLSHPPSLPLFLSFLPSFSTGDGSQGLTFARQALHHLNFKTFLDRAKFLTEGKTCLLSSLFYNKSQNSPIPGGDYMKFLSEKLVEEERDLDRKLSWRQSCGQKKKDLWQGMVSGEKAELS
jgi:hypothetical protein